MKSMRYLLAIGLLAFAVQAKADWIGSDISDIINNVKTIVAEVMGDVKNAASELVQQINALNAQGQTVRETVQDALDFVQHRRTPFKNFVFVNGDSNNPRCGQGSPCANFRTDLDGFVLDMADLRALFPQIERHGLGDGTIAVDVIDHLPPIALFAAYEIFSNLPGWQDIPQNLSDLHDEIGDDDAWVLTAPAATTAAAEPVAQVVVAGKKASGQSLFGLPRDGIEKFCSNHGKPRPNPVRGNRLKAFVTHLRNLGAGIGEAVPESKTIVAGGEGTSIHIPVRAIIGGIALVMDSIATQLETYFANIDECRKIEADVLAQSKLIQYRTSIGVRKAYWVVRGVIDHNGIADPIAENALSDAGTLWSGGGYRDAYNRIVDAYQSLIR